MSLNQRPSSNASWSRPFTNSFPSASTPSNLNHNHNHNHNHTQNHNRLPSSLSSTPVPAPHRNPVFSQHTPSSATILPSSATRFGGLSAKQVNKISSTIASVRDPSRPSSRLHPQSRGDLPFPLTNNKHRTLKFGPTSFSEAPLNSRLPAITPRKASTRTAHRAYNDSSSDEIDQDQTHEFLTKLRATPAHHQTRTHSRQGDRESLKTLELGLQEALIIEDLLFVLMGIEGTFIEFDGSYSPDDQFERLQGARFVVDDDLDPSLRELVERILPLATYYTSIDAFVAAHSHLDCGLVNHALCASIRDLLKDYMVLVVQLEDQFHRSPDFTLQRFWFYIHDMLHTLKLLHSFTSELVCLYSPDLMSSDGDGEGGATDDDWEQEPGLKAVLQEYDPERRWKSKSGRESRAGMAEGAMVKGGEVLAVLEERVMRTLGDPIASRLYADLLLKASQPYCKMLIQWVTKGILDDPYEEFMVKESKSITRGTLEVDFTDEYWERKYILRNRAVDSNLAPSDPSARADGRWAQTGRAAWRRERGVCGGAVVPRFLEVWEGKILLAGKYVNVMRECGVERQEAQWAGEPVDTSVESAGLIKMDDAHFYALIDRAYVSANRLLLELLMKSEDLLGRLRSLKHHFFLSQGDSFTTFLDSASYELGKKLKHVNVSRLQNQFDLAIRNPSSSSSSDPYKEDVKVTMAGTSLTEWLLRIVGVTGAIGGSLGPGGAQGRAGSMVGEGGGNGENREAMDAVGAGLAELAAGGTPATGEGVHSAATDSKKDGLTGIEALQLDYTVRFPLSLVISRKTILRYQLIFRYLLHLKHLEQSLTHSWTEHIKSMAWKSSAKVDGRLECWKRRIFNLRAKMLSFVQSLYNFVCFEVLEKNYLKLEERLGKVETVDGLLKEHVDFLDTCLKECMLTNSKLLKIHQKLTTTCSMFASYTSHFTKSAHSFNVAFGRSAASREPDGGGIGQAEVEEMRHKFGQAEVALKKFEQNFSHHSQVHVDMVTFFASSENLALLALAVRLTNVKSSGVP